MPAVCNLGCQGTTATPLFEEGSTCNDNGNFHEFHLLLAEDGGGKIDKKHLVHARGKQGKNGR